MGSQATITSTAAAPWLDLTIAGEFEAWRRGLSRNTRRSRARRVRDLGQSGTVTFTFDRAGGGDVGRVRDLFALKRAWAQARSVVSRTIDDRAFEALICDLVGDGRSIDCRLSTLSLDGRPIAMELGFIAGRRYLSYIGAYDPAYAQHSPGALQLERTLQACFDEGIAAFDLLPPGDAYKASWATGDVAVASHCLALTAVGRMQASAARIDMGSRAKAAFGRLPQPVRRSLGPLARSLIGRRQAQALSDRARTLILTAAQLAALGLAAALVVAD